MRMRRSLALTLAGGAAGAALSLVGTAAMAAPPSHTWGNARDGEKGYAIGCVIAREFLDVQGACLELFQGLDGPYDLDYPLDPSPNDEPEGDDDGEGEEPAPPAESVGGGGGGIGGGGGGGGGSFIAGGGSSSGGTSHGTVEVGEIETVAE